MSTENSNIEYVRLPLPLLNDTSVSKSARFLLCWMLANNYPFINRKELCRANKISIVSLSKYIDELVKGGYLIRNGRQLKYNKAKI